MIELAKGNSPYEIVEGVNEGVLNSFSDWVQFCMLYSACEMHPFYMPVPDKPSARGPPGVLHFRKIAKWRTKGCQNGYE